VCSLASLLFAWVEVVAGSKEQRSRLAYLVIRGAPWDLAGFQLQAAQAACRRRGWLHTDVSDLCCMLEGLHRATLMAWPIPSFARPSNQCN